MALIDTDRERAGLLLLVLGGAIIVAILPFASGIIGIPVLYVIFQPIHRRIAPWLRPRLSAALTVALALVAVVGLALAFTGVVVNQARILATGMEGSHLLTRVGELRLGGLEVGPRLEDFGERILDWLGTSAFGIIGTATRLALNLVIAVFGLYYALLGGADVWKAVAPHIPFSPQNVGLLRTRFRDVTISTVVGTGLTAAIQGTLVGLGFWVTGLPNALFWGAVTVLFAILPVVGSALVWGPGVVALAFDGRAGTAVALVLWGLVIVTNVDYVIRPMVYRRWAKIHPLITLIGAVAGVPHFGVVGLLIGPLALSYLFELIRIYREEYLTLSGTFAGAPPGASA